MRHKYNKTCLVCGKVYTFCTGCSEFDTEPRWRAIYCCDNCKTIFRALTEYCANNITKEEVKEILNDCDLSKKDTFNPSIIKELDEIYKEQIVPEVAAPVEEKDIKINKTIETNPEKIEYSKPKGQKGKTIPYKNGRKK